ncbi:MAG: CHRD domain-containing protein [Acidimicrobiales bacterium]
MRIIKGMAVLGALGAALVFGAATPSGAITDHWVFNAGMNGSREVPGPGDTGASGHARITVDVETGEICWELTVRNVEETVIAAHIHVGARDVAGPIVQALTPPTTGESSGCATNADVADAIVADPSGYYVNVHSTLFPGGAVRGQLAGPHN